MIRINKKIGCVLAVSTSLLMFGACKLNVMSDLKVSETDCSNLNREAQLGQMIGQVITLGLQGAGFIVPQIQTAVDQANSLVEQVNAWNPTGQTIPAPQEALSRAIGGTGCDGAANDLEIFMNITNNRINNLWNTLNLIVQTEGKKFATVEIGEINNHWQKMYTYFQRIRNTNDQPTIANTLNSMTDVLTEFGTTMYTIELLAKTDPNISYFSTIFTGGFPYAFDTLITGSNIIKSFKDKIPAECMSSNSGRSSRSNCPSGQSARDALAKFLEARTKFGNFTYLLESQMKNFPGIDFEIGALPPPTSTSPAADSSCSTQGNFTFTWATTKNVDYTFLAFGMKALQGNEPIGELRVNLAPYPGCRSASDHPGFNKAIAEALLSSNPNIKAKKVELDRMYASLKPASDLKALRDKIHWVKDPLLTPWRYGGLSHSPYIWGANNRGTHFDDYTSLSNNTLTPLLVKKVRVKYGERIDKVCITIEGRPEVCHGGSGGDHEKSIDLGPNEYITRVEVGAKTFDANSGSIRTFKSRVMAIRFDTNLRSEVISVGTWADTAQTKFELPAEPAGAKIVGFHGREGDEVDALGVIYSFGQGPIENQTSTSQPRRNAPAPSPAPTNRPSRVP